MSVRSRNTKGIGGGGFTLVELMVSLFIVGIVMLGWWRIMNATSPYREAQRRAAVEVAAGILDIFPTDVADNATSFPVWYKVKADGSFSVSVAESRQSFPSEWFPSESPVRYTLKLVEGAGDQAWTRWDYDGECLTPLSRTVWLVVELFDGDDTSSHPAAFTQLKQVVSAVY